MQSKTGLVTDMLNIVMQNLDGGGMKFLLSPNLMKNAVIEALESGIDQIDHQWQEYLDDNIGNIERAGHTMQLWAGITPDRIIDPGSSVTVTSIWTDSTEDNRSSYLIDGTPGFLGTPERNDAIEWAMDKLKVDKDTAHIIAKSIADHGTTSGHTGDYPEGERRYDFPEHYAQILFPLYEGNVSQIMEQRLSNVLGI